MYYLGTFNKSTTFKYTTAYFLLNLFKTMKCMMSYQQLQINAN